MSEIKDKPNAPDLSGLVDQMKGIDADTFHDALKEHLPDHYNKVFRTGYGTAKGEFAHQIVTGKQDRSGPGRWVYL